MSQQIILQKKKRIYKPRHATIHYRNTKKLVFIHYFGPDFCCDDCGEKDIRVLELDHPEGGGNKQRRELCGRTDYCGVRFYLWLKTHGYPKLILRPRCSNCHIKITFDRIEAKYNNV